jgi:hypothetical protein
MLAAFLLFLRERQLIWQARVLNKPDLATNTSNIFQHKKFTNIFRHSAL